MHNTLQFFAAWNRCRIWKVNSGLLETSSVASAALCAEHFEAKCFLRADLRKRLTDTAIPTIFKSTSKLLGVFCHAENI